MTTTYPGLLRDTHLIPLASIQDFRWRSAFVKLSAICMFTIATSIAIAADFIPNHEPDPNAPPGSLSNVLIRGQIVEGDAERLVTFISGFRSRRMPLLFLLDSPGGAVQDAIRIALIIDSIYGTTRVDNSIQMEASPTERGFLCASACFYLYVAGAVRWPPIVPSAGQIGIHRPYFARNPKLDLKKEVESHEAILIAARRYLEKHRVPTRLIELSFSRSSAEIYWLNVKDSVEVGFISPAIEEIAIRECKYQPALSRRIFEDRTTPPQFAIGESLTCLNDILAPSIRDAYARLARGQRPWQ